MALAPDINAIEVEVHDGQLRALESDRRIVCVAAGSGGGKTTIGPGWLLGEVRRHWQANATTNDYLVAAPTIALSRVALDKLAIYLRHPAFGMRGVGDANDGWKASERTWYLRNGARIRFGSADNPGSLEAVHYRAAWCDEWGQVDDYAHNTVRRRLAFYKGRWLITTTPYPEFTTTTASRTWLRTMVEDARAGRDPDVEVVTFPAWWNPAYPMDEVERLRRTLPAWQFAMFVEGLLTRPQGAIYDLFNEAEHVVDPLPLETPIYETGYDGAMVQVGVDPWVHERGMDFGGTNPTAILWIATSPDDVAYVYGERVAANRTMRSHMIAMGAGANDLPPAAPNTADASAFDGVGWGPEPAELTYCDPAGAQSIMDLNYAGIVARGADNDVEEGIREVYERLATGRLKIIRTRAPVLVNGLLNYRRGDNGKPVKVDDHAPDALRYWAMGHKRWHRGHIATGFA